ncbi:uncharacterized protein PAC_16509 [Phialocephala subalpina]|uniref:2EXR domain-containing protein n=1 Tax=Phialocephala subalpina TaxID=576137 RepID=A0A1L7XNK5_9HELO|nr:uncharacterized protein PAC_16509 [Phialocephala subalpina]
MAAMTNAQTLVPLSECARRHLEFLEPRDVRSSAVSRDGGSFEQATVARVASSSSSSSLKDQDADDETNPSFIPFERLPTELKNQIWKFFIQQTPRIVRLAPHSNPPVPLRQINSKLRDEYEDHGFVTIKQKRTNGLVDIIFHPDVDLLYYLPSGPYLNALGNIENALVASGVMDRIKFLAFDVFDTSPILALLKNHALSALELVIVNFSDDGSLHRQQSKTTWHPIGQMKASWSMFYDEGEEMKSIRLGDLPKLFQEEYVKNSGRSIPQVVMVERKRAT